MANPSTLPWALSYTFAAILVLILGSFSETPEACPPTR